MKKIFLLFLTVIFLISCTHTNKVCFNKNCFNVEIADTIPERQIGLMNRDTLDQNKGMLFIYEREGIYTFWMKNTKIPLDIMWLDKNKKVVYINKNTPPCLNDPCPSYIPTNFAQYILEVNAGRVDQLNIQVGDQVTF